LKYKSLISPFSNFYYFPLPGWERIKVRVKKRNKFPLTLSLSRHAYGRSLRRQRGEGK